VAKIQKFGAFVRHLRMERDIGLREMAKKIGISPTYLSKFERDECDPPTEDRVRAIAEILGCDTEELMAKAGRLPSELSDIFKRHPLELATLLRTTNGMSAEDILRLAQSVKNKSQKQR
jgi:transcriptional regulator with XRE-family HTH domain